jgi:hypothetical protein
MLVPQPSTLNVPTGSGRTLKLSINETTPICSSRCQSSSLLALNRPLLKRNISHSCRLLTDNDKEQIWIKHHQPNSTNKTKPFNRPKSSSWNEVIDVTV